MNSNLTRIVGLLVAIGQAHFVAAQTTVETYTVTGTYSVLLPGAPDPPSGLLFDITFNQTSLDFAPGAVTFQGSPVDFDGTEASFLAGSYTGTANVPVNFGPAIVPATGTGTSTGVVNSSWGFDMGPLNLGPAFGGANLDIVPGSGTGSATTNNWNSTVIPELNGLVVTFDSNYSILNVDAVNGIVDSQSQGSVTAVSTIPTLSTWGLVLLVVGIGGAAVTVLRRRGLQTGTPAV